MKKIVPSLNGLRSISIAIVVVYHLLMNFYIPHAAVLEIVIDGSLGVNIFFIISGFLITSLLMAEEAGTHKVSIRNFYLRRILRIFPAYYFLLIVYFVMQMAGVLHLSTNSWLTALTFTKQFNWRGDWDTGHLWSLSVEEFFYLFWPLVFIKFKEGRNKISLAIIFIVIISRVLLAKYPINGLDQLTIFQRGDALMIGSLFALHHDKIARVNSGKFANLRLILYAMTLVAFLALGKVVDYFSLKQLAPYVRTLFGNHGVLSNLLIANIMVLSINVKNLWYKFLNNGPMNYIGKLSYSIYLWQQYFVTPILGLTQFYIPLSILMILAAANFSYYLIEKPFLKLKSKFE